MTHQNSTGEHYDIGHCRRYPKAFKAQTETRCMGLGMGITSSIVSVSEYPEHREDDWCGEFKPKDEEPQQSVDDKHIIDVVTKAAQSDGPYRRVHGLENTTKAERTKDNGQA